MLLLKKLLKMKTIYLIIVAIISTTLLLNCGDSKEKSTAAVSTKKDSAKAIVPVEISKKAPIINLEDTIDIKRTLICIKDSSKTREGMYAKLQTIYNVKLADCIKQNKLTITGNPTAWHTMQKKAFFFEAGIPVDKTPTKACKAVYTKSINNDSTFTAHFFGPNDMIDGAYEILNEKLKESKKSRLGAIYEIYYGDQFSLSAQPKDFYKLQTDVVLAYK
jgi:effector-binding domain-containing protein